MTKKKIFLIVTTFIVFTCIVSVNDSPNLNVQHNTNQSDIIEKTNSKDYNSLPKVTPYDIFGTQKSDCIDDTLYADIDIITNIIQELSAVPRLFGSLGEVNSCNMLQKIFRDYGYTVKTQTFDVYKQDSISMDVSNTSDDYFILNPYDSLSLGVAHNIIITNKNYDKNKKSLYITAHYDTTSSSNGVIDNASGVAVITELARILEAKEFDFNIIYILFSAEEYYKYGSKYYLSNIENNSADILGCFNIDMVALKNSGNIIIKTMYARPNILSILVNKYFTLSHTDYGGMSDDLSFYMAQIPVIHFFNNSVDPRTLGSDNNISLIDKEQLIAFINDLVSCINEFDLNSYNNLLINGYTETHTCFTPQFSLDQWYLSELTYQLNSTGFTSIINSTFINGQHSILLSEEDMRFNSTLTSSNEYKKGNNFIYQISSNNNAIEYVSSYNNNIGGILTSSISIEKALLFLDNRFNNYHKNSIPTQMYDQWLIYSSN